MENGVALPEGFSMQMFYDLKFIEKLFFHDFYLGNEQVGFGNVGFCYGFLDAKDH